MERIPLRMGILNLLHEILHAFGASHDPKGVLAFLYLPTQKVINLESDTFGNPIFQKVVLN